ncbi:MAG: hypothetical protein H7Y88_13660 [Phycisphaerales bacterium]|nr:hypothetical protein [Phycisphaerales bacterium]
MNRFQFAAASFSLAAAPALMAQGFMTGFETPTYTGSAAGTGIAGQDSWFIPAVAGSIDGLVMTYAGNAFGLPVNPSGGGEQLLVSRSNGGTAFARSQREGMTFDTVSEFCYDVAGAFNGTPPSAQNLGSFSLQPLPNPAIPTSKGLIQLNTWVDVNNPTSWSVSYLAYDAGGVLFAGSGQFAGPEWQNLPLNHWFRVCTTIDFSLNMVTSVSITDLTTNITASAAPINWFLGGGQNSTLPVPTGVRFFAGGAAGNIMAWDNANFGVELPPPCPADFNDSGSVTSADITSFLSAWFADVLNGTTVADFNESGGTTSADITAFLAAWFEAIANGC